MDMAQYDASVGGGMHGGMDLSLFGDMMAGAPDAYSSEEAMRASLAWIDSL